MERVVEKLVVGNKFRGAAMFVCLSFLLVACHDDNDPEKQTDNNDFDPAEISLGERLFLETRFAQFFKANANDANSPLSQGDPATSHTITTAGTIASPFAGQSMNCASCHLVDQHLDAENAGMRTYADFAPRPPIPSRADRGDSNTFAPRNSQSLVGVNHGNADQLILHFDAEFNTMLDLVKATLTGRNYGWLADEGNQAIQHIANIIRQDNGAGELAREFGGSYSRILTATDPAIAEQFRLPEEFRVDVQNAADEEIFSAVARLIAAYVDDLAFSSDDTGIANGSPFDAFLQNNGLPTSPLPEESDEAYGARLLQQLSKLERPQFIPGNGESQTFAFHQQTFTFAELELEGLKIFLRDGSNSSENSGIGNCIACHAPPDFSDFGLHNTGVSQHEYDAIHGQGTFADMYIPDLATRNGDVEQYLPPSATHPGASGRFRAIASAADPSLADLGAWNIFANPEINAPQARLRQLLCALKPEAECGSLSDNELLTLSVASFKTPQLRDLGHSSPFMHNGAFNDLESVVRFYQDMAKLARDGDLRNSSADIAKIRLEESDIQALTAFLKALNEDYE